MTVDEATLVKALRGSHGLEIPAVDHLTAGVTTRNFTAVDGAVGPVFVKVYPADADLAAQKQAIRLGELAATAGVPTAHLVRGRTGERIATAAGLAYSVWWFMDAPSGHDTGLTHEQMRHMGAVLGRMHRRFAQHPISLATPGARAPLPGLTHTAGVIGGLLDTIDPDDGDPLRVWIRDALRERAAILDQVRALTGYSAQVIHGDLASPNVLLADDEVAAVIDFCPPGVGALAHDISRIGCDPRTVVRLGDAWPAALATLAAAYREHNPAIGAADVVGCVRWWIRYTAASMYPLRTLLAGGPCADADLAVYARQRLHALLAVLDLADEAETPLGDAVSAAAGPG